MYFQERRSVRGRGGGCKQGDEEGGDGDKQGVGWVGECSTSNHHHHSGQGEAGSLFFPLYLLSVDGISLYISSAGGALKVATKLRLLSRGGKGGRGGYDGQDLRPQHRDKLYPSNLHI